MPNINIQSIPRTLGVVAAISVAAMAHATDKIYNWDHTVTGSAVRYDTRTVFPQINEIPSYHQEVDHDFVPSPNHDAPNNLAAGMIKKVYRNVFNSGSRFPSITFTGWVPPDTDFAVGPTHVVTVVNDAVAFHLKSTGAKIFQQNMDGAGFFSGITQSTFQFDPKAFYDPISKRFFVLCLDGADSTSRFLVAVSDDSDPTGVWYKYSFDASITLGSDKYWLDYPGFGFGKDAIAITGNMFPVSNGNFGGVNVTTFPKAAMLTGGTVTGKSVRLPSGFTLQPSRTMDTADSNIYAAETGGGSSMNVYVIKNPATNPVVQQTSVTVATYGFPGRAASTGGLSLDTHGGRTYVCTKRPGRLYAAHTIAASGGRTQARWYEVDLRGWPTSGSQPIIRQTGNVTPASGEYTCNPGIAANKFNDIGVMFTRSSTGIAADIQIASRVGNDPLGTLGTPTTLQSSLSSPTGMGGRWGDYSAVTVDPVDDATFWGYSMTLRNDGTWNTSFYKWTVSSGGGTTGTSFAPISFDTTLGNQANGDLTSVIDSDDSRYGIDTEFVDQLGQVAAAEATWMIPTPVGQTQADMAVAVETRGIAAASGSVFLWNWTLNRYELAGSFSMGTTDRTTSVVVKSFQKYINGTGQVKALIRGLNPVKAGRNGGSPAPFRFDFDQVKIVANFS